MEVQMMQLRDQVQRREADISTLKQHLALLTSDFKYNLKLLEDRDFELDQTEAQLEQIKNLEKQKETEMELLNSEIVNFKAMADRDAEQIRSLESTLSQYKESVRSVRERLEEALQLRDQELTCHRSELEALKTKIQQQSESIKVQEQGLSDAMKACERTWSQRYSECHKTVMTLVAEQESLLKEKLAKDREMEIMQNRVLELQKSVDELTGVTDVSRKECTTLTGQLEILQELANTRVKELEVEKQSLERNLRKKILEEYDGKIAELLAQLQSIEYAVSLERREANTRLITMEAQQVEKITSLHQTIQELRGERNDLLDKVGNLEKELASLKENIFHLKCNGKRFSQKEENLTKEVSTLQHTLHEAKTMLEKSQAEKGDEIAALHESLCEARSKENLISGREAEQTKRIGILEQLLDDARSKVEQLSKKDSDENEELRVAQEALEQTKKELYMIAHKNSEQLKEIATLKNSLTEARNHGAMLSRTQAEHTEELAFLKQSLYDARNHGETMARKYGENSKDLENLRQLLNAARTQEELMRKKLEGQAKEIVSLQEALLRAKADGELLMKTEAAHTEEISALHSNLAETQKQADAAFKHAQHLNAIFEVTQAESRRRVEIKECVSSLITSAQDQQESFCRHDNEFSDSPCELVALNMDHCKEFDSGCDTRLMGFSSGCKIRLEEENRFLKARVEELQGENFKVGQVISELRNELETVGLLQPSTGCDIHDFASQPQNVVNFPPQGEEITTNQRQAKMPSGSTWKDDSPQAMLRANARDNFQEKEDMSLTEKEELLTLRALLKDVHNRNELHKQVSISVPAEKTPERRAELNPSAYKSAGRRDLPGGSSKRLTTHIDRHNHSTELDDTPRVYKDEMRNSVGQPTSKPPTFIADNSRRLPEPRSMQSTAEAKTSLGVSAEVLRLNEQIARVRQQLTSLCSPDQSVSSRHKSSEERMPRSKSRYSGKSAHTDEPFGSASHENKAGENSGEAAKNKGELHLRNFHVQHHKEAQQDKVAEKAARGTQHDFHRRQPQELELEQPATMRNNRKPQALDVLKSSEVFLSTKNTAAKTVRPTARDSLGTRARTKVGRKTRVKVPSVTSSRSDVVCSHCQECISDEDCQGLLSPSPELSYTESPKPSNAKERDDHRCSPWAHGHASVFTSYGSDERERNQDDVRKSQPQSRTWTDTDESDPASSIQHTCTVHPHNIAHADPKKPRHNIGRDRRYVTRENSPKAKSHAAKEENLLRKHSTSERKRGSGTVNTPRRGSKVERSIPVIVRERVLSQQDPNHSRVSTSRSAKIY